MKDENKYFVVYKHLATRKQRVCCKSPQKLFLSSLFSSRQQISGNHMSMSSTVVLKFSTHSRNLFLLQSKAVDPIVIHLGATNGVFLCSCTLISGPLRQGSPMTLPLSECKQSAHTVIYLPCCRQGSHLQSSKGFFLYLPPFPVENEWVICAVRYHTQVSKLFHDSSNPSSPAHQLAGTRISPPSFIMVDSNNGFN